jgi:excisionase family DNA binding protein
MNQSAPEFISTATAAQMLGLSTTMIQSLVDKNELQGWKTQGGHRRISMQSIHEYKSNSRISSSAPVRGPMAPKVMVVMESEQTLSKLQKRSQEWGFALELQFVDSVTEALLSLGGNRPDLLVVELTMAREQQQKTVQALENFNSRGRPISMVLITQEKGLMSGLASVSSGIQLVTGPLSESWLHAYLTGVTATCRT